MFWSTLGEVFCALPFCPLCVWCGWAWREDEKPQKVGEESPQARFVCGWMRAPVIPFRDVGNQGNHPTTRKMALGTCYGNCDPENLKMGFCFPSTAAFPMSHLAISPRHLWILDDTGRQGNPLSIENGRVSRPIPIFLQDVF